jgi:hypothetical protein
MQAFQLFLNKEKNLRPRTNYPAFTRATAWHKWLSRLARNWSFIIKAAKVRFPPCGEVGAKSCLGRKVRCAVVRAGRSEGLHSANNVRVRERQLYVHLSLLLHLIPQNSVTKSPSHQVTKSPEVFSYLTSVSSPRSSWGGAGLSSRFVLRPPLRACPAPPGPLPA